MPKYRKKPVVIEARQVTDEERDRVCVWAIEGGATAYVPFSNDGIVIKTLEGDMKADIGDWIIRGVKGEHYPCKPDIFEATYEEECRQVESSQALPFSEALEKLKCGKRVARAGWNGKGMYVWIEKGSSPIEVADRNRDLINGVGAEHFDFGPEGSTTRMPHFCMRAADGSTVTGWLASQTDMLAEDWTVLPA